jgi:hypothetical protein
MLDWVSGGADLRTRVYGKGGYFEGVQINGVTVSWEWVRGVFIPMQHPWISAFIVVSFVFLVSSFSEVSLYCPVPVWLQHRGSRR